MMNIELHPFSRNDFPDLISWIRSPEELFLWSADTFTFPLDEAQLETHLQKTQETDTRQMFTAVDRNTGKSIGHIELTRIDREKGKASIAYVLVNPSRRGLGYGKGLVQKILDQCFHQMSMSKVDLFVFEHNTPAVECYRKVGFQMEEVISDRLKFKGKFVTLYLMGINKEAWNPLS